MKNLIYVTLFACALTFSIGCKKDDNGEGGTGGGDGDLKVTLSWDQSNADLDLYFSGPNTSVGTFSGDDMGGPGTESWTFTDSAEDGDYTAKVEWYDGTGNVSYTLRIQSADSNEIITETVSASSKIDIHMFNKNGRTLSF